MVDNYELNLQTRKRWAALRAERSSWDAHWGEISRFLFPRAGRFTPSSRNRGTKVHDNIYDSTGCKALRTLVAGLMAGVTSPARPWFRLTTNDVKLDESAGVKQWLAETQRQMLMTFAKSNTYRALHSMYEELGAFGTAACIVTDSEDGIIHLHPLTIGEYAISKDNLGFVNTIYREFDLTVWELVENFGLDNVSTSVQRLYEDKNYDKWTTVIHGISPLPEGEFDPEDPEAMRWQSVYIENGATAEKILFKSLFKRFQALCPRWATSGGDIYGNSPGMDALGDIKQLQHEQLCKAQGIEYMVNPPLQVPANLRNRELNTLPGGSTYVDMSSGTAPGIRTMFDVQLDLRALLEDIQDIRERIRGCFYADLFLMLSNLPMTGKLTATEVAERHEEKMLMLGPVLERLQNELLSPLIDLTFDALARKGLLPEPPQELQDKELSVEYVSMLSQAQRAVSTNSIDRFVGAMANVATMQPQVLDKFSADAWADTYSDLLGIDPDLVRAESDVNRIREQRAQQPQAMSPETGAEEEETISLEPALVEAAKDIEAVDVFSQEADTAAKYS